MVFKAQEKEGIIYTHQETMEDKQGDQLELGYGLEHAGSEVYMHSAVVKSTEPL